MTYVAEQQDQRTSSTHDLPSPRWNEAVTDALSLLRAPLATFVRQQMQQEYGDGWVNCALGALHSATGSRHSRPQDLDHDLSAMLHTVINFWQMAFRRASPRFMRTHLEEVREFRNALAHGEYLTLADALRAVDTVHRLLALIGESDRTRSGRLRGTLLQMHVGRLSSAISRGAAVQQAGDSRADG
jgi:hypothetical protein